MTQILNLGPTVSNHGLRNQGFPVALVVKNLPADAGDLRDAGLIPGSGRSPGGGHGNPLQYSCMENPMDRGAWRATVHGVTKRWTQLKQLSTAQQILVCLYTSHRFMGPPTPTLI